MTAEEWKSAGAPFEATDGTAALYQDAALDWMREHTTLTAAGTPDAVAALPSGAKLFLLRYRELMERDSIVTSESLAGMSQSFSDRSRDQLVKQLAKGLLGAWLPPDVRFYACQRRWRE